MYFGELPYVSQAALDRSLLRRAKRRAKENRSRTFARLATVGHVELDKIPMPDWAKAKAVRGLTLTDRSIWLRRISARKLMREDEAAGGTPRVTFTVWRFCQICQRSRLGLEAEYKAHVDRLGPRNPPCGPDCLEIERHRLESAQANSPAKRQRNGKAK